MNKKYNILILCGANPYKGPGIVALDLYNSFSQHGDIVRILSNQPLPATDKNIIALPQTFISRHRILRRIHSFVIRSKRKKLSTKYLMFSVEDQLSNKWGKKIIDTIDDKCDIIIYLFSHNFLSYADIKKLYVTYHVPVMFWMVDQALLTGGCHYPWDCEGYKKLCGNCPGIQSNDPEDQTRQNMQYKKNIFDAIKLYPIYSTEIQQKMLAETLTFKNYTKYKIPVPIDPAKFHDGNNDAIRPRYNLPVDKKIILFASQQLEDERKGIVYLLKSLQIVSSELSSEEWNNIVLVIAGNQITDNALIQSYDHRYLGYLSHIEFAEVLSVADIFVCPSVEDAGPMVINQALMSGTPVVAFDVGVASELIEIGKTGYRAKLRDENDLANGILTLMRMNPDEASVMSRQCRENAMNLYSIEKVVSQFHSIFKEIIN
jgi:glycosyltransferase involved in cell wall biosynthesis